MLTTLILAFFIAAFLCALIRIIIGIFHVVVLVFMFFIVLCMLNLAAPHPFPGLNEPQPVHQQGVHRVVS